MRRLSPGLGIKAIELHRCDVFTDSERTCIPERNTYDMNRAAKMVFAER
jgi:hypothetical protein